MKKKISMNGLIKIVPLAILCIVTGMINPVFFAGSNLIDLARSVSFLLIVSVGVTYVLLGASLDMSIGSVWGLGRNLRIVPRKQPSCLVLHSYGTSGISCGWHSKCGIDRQLQDPGTDCHLGNHVCGKGNRECTDEGRTVLSAAG